MVKSKKAHSYHQPRSLEDDYSRLDTILAHICSGLCKMRHFQKYYFQPEMWLFSLSLWFKMNFWFYRRIIMTTDQFYYETLLNKSQSILIRFLILNPISVFVFFFLCIYRYISKYMNMFGNTVWLMKMIFFFYFLKMKKQKWKWNFWFLHQHWDLSKRKSLPWINSDWFYFITQL